MSAVPIPPPPSLFDELRERRVFIVARIADKHPINPHTRLNSDAQAPSTWLTPAEAHAHVARLGAGYGVGIVLSPGTKLACIDIDGAWDGAAWSSLAVTLLQLFAGAYVEVSISGRGLHIIFSYSGEFPLHACKNTALHIELYHEARYILLTGTHARGSVLRDCTDLALGVVYEYFQPASSTAATPAEWTTAPKWHAPGGPDDEALIARARRSKSGKAVFGDGVTFVELWDADAEALGKRWPANKPGEPYDASSADQSLANRLMWWTGGDCERTESLMRQSKLGEGRDWKWDREDYMRGTIHEAFAFVAKNPPKDKSAEPTETEADPRAVILLNSGKLDQYAIRGEELIADTVYVRGGDLVRIGVGSEIVNNSGITRASHAAICIPASAPWIRGALMRRAQFWKYDKRSGEWEAKDCPKELADYISGQQGWTAFRPLLAISPVPILRPDLSVWTEPGYDAATGVFYQPTVAFPAIPPTPTREDALAALARLHEPFDEFPFATHEARAAFLSHLIAAIVRPSFDTCPIYFYTAPDVANGKTLLSSMPNRIAHGSAAAQHPYAEKEELRKTLFAALLAGDAEIIFDNVPKGVKVRADGLCVFATSGTYSDRVLGVSENRKVPNRLIVVLTGNNITPAGDLSRRALPVRLVVKAESARGRTFRIPDLKRYVAERRAQYIVDAITIVRAYAFAGSPPVGTHPLESFEEWSRLVRDPLVWLGMADPVSTQASETEDDGAPLPAAFVALAAATESMGHTFSAAELAPVVTFNTTGLREALIAADCKEPSDAVSLGYWLRGMRDRVAGGWMLERDSKSETGARWRLRAI